MLFTARQEAQARVAPNRLCQVGIEALPFAAEVFDLVVAGHVLYDLRNIGSGVRELARVLRPDGCLLATTNSSEHAARVLVLDLHYQALADLDIQFRREEEPFSMDNGRPLLKAAFGRVDAYVFRDTSTAEDVAAFMAGYLTIGRYKLVVDSENV